MLKLTYFNHLAVKLTLAFLVTAILSVSLVALLAYRFTSQDFSTFTGHVQRMEQMMGDAPGGMGGMMKGMMGQGTMPGINLAQAETEFFENFERALWISGLSGAALALILGFFFTRQIVSPVGNISKAARVISGGNLNQRVEVRGSDEIAELGKSFNSMAESLNKDREWRHQMLADIAHELRTPLFILQGNTEAMLDGVLPASKENLTTIHQETLFLSRLVEDLRTLSLAEVGQLKFQPVATGIKELASKILDGFKAQAVTRNISLSLEDDGNPGIARVDPGRMEQVMRNLLTNAFQYTPEEGKISIKIASDRERITISVIDTGIGIPAEDLPRVFDRFYRVDRSRARSTGGSGLGLAIVKQLVEGQGGSIWAESAAGKGSAFTLSVPAARS